LLVAGESIDGFGELAEGPLDAFETLLLVLPVAGGYRGRVRRGNGPGRLRGGRDERVDAPGSRGGLGAGAPDAGHTAVLNGDLSRVTVGTADQQVVIAVALDCAVGVERHVELPHEAVAASVNREHRPAGAAWLISERDVPEVGLAIISAGGGRR